MKLMYLFLKSVYWTSILIISFWTLGAIFGAFFPIEFSNNHNEFVYYNIGAFGFPLTILLSLSWTIKKNDTKDTIITKVFSTIIISIFTLFVMFMSIFLFVGMCDWSTERVLFENKKNSSIKIAERSYGCGAVDSSPPTIRVFTVREITPYFIWVTNIDTTQINKSEWKRIE